ncbi:MAG: sugar phosphate nucleotidyltransferase, partial [Kangiellaceae bacterium]|nr:sugar phosphate nucleotidyltransferase [Kangiellaceae bacterium]
NFIGDSHCSLILGDNFFYGQDFTPKLLAAKGRESGASIFCHRVQDPHSYGVVELDSNSNVLSIEEKPAQPKSNYVATGLYFYDNRVVEYAKQVQPSARGELEITDINLMYLAEQQLKSELLGRGFAWFDMGTHDDLLRAGQFVAMIERQQGLKIACLEEIAFHHGWINHAQLKQQIILYKNTAYGDYLSYIAR